MAKLNLEPSEQDILDGFDADEFQSDLSAERKAFLADTAEANQKKDKRINIRLSSRDLSAIQKKALKEGLPYQTLVSSILHKYVSGSLQDLSQNSKS